MRANYLDLRLTQSAIAIRMRCLTSLKYTDGDPLDGVTNLHAGAGRSLKSEQPMNNRVF